MTADWIEHEACINCGGSLLPYRTATTAPYLLVDFCNGTFPVTTTSVFVKCSACGLVAQSPRMNDELIVYFYSSGAYRETLGLSVEDMDRDEKKRASDVSMWLLRRDVEPKRHLDIGCSRGYLLEHMGAKVQHGYDNNPSYSKTITVHSDKSKLQLYDLVTSVHV